MKKSIFLKILAFNLFFVSNFAFAYHRDFPFFEGFARFLLGIALIHAFYLLVLFIFSVIRIIFSIIRFIFSIFTDSEEVKTEPESESDLEPDWEEEKEMTLENLSFMKKHSNEFDWTRLKQKIKNIFISVTNARASGDYNQVSDLVNILFLKGSQGMSHDWLNNIKIKNISQISPILFKPTSYKQSYIDSLLVVIIEFDVTSENENHIMNQIWSFTFEDGNWKVCNIEDFTELEQYLDESNELGTFEELQ